MPSEEDTDRNGFLSYSGEWHALTVGFGMGYYAPFELQSAFLGSIFARNKEQIKHQFKNSGHMKDARMKELHLKQKI